MYLFSFNSEVGVLLASSNYRQGDGTFETQPFSLLPPPPPRANPGATPFTNLITKPMSI